MRQNMITDNSSLIHMEGGNIFYDNFNTNEDFYNFLLVQEDRTKEFILKRMLYYYSFERYMKQFFPAFSLEESEKYNFLKNKNSNIYSINSTIGLNL